MGWADPDVKVDFYHLKGIVEGLTSQFHIRGLSFQKTQHVFLESATSQAVVCDSEVIGALGKLCSEQKSLWDIPDDVFIFEFDLEQFLQCIPQETRYQPISKFPSVKRDLALVVTDKVQAGEIQNHITHCGAPLLTSVSLFDLYKGNQLDRGRKSLAFSLEFSSSSKTLTEDEIEPVMKSIIEGVEQKFSARLRS